MQFTIALVATIMASAISAAPVSPATTYPTVRVSLYNDQTGRMATKDIVSNGMVNKLPELFKGTPIDENGAIKATSAQLVGSTQLTRCFFQNYNDIINISPDHPFADLDGNPSAAIVRDMSGFNIQCSERGGA